MMRSLLRRWILINRRDRYGRAGFVLPTVTMVLLVVVLLTVAITLRSFERAKVAQYRRVDEAVLQAATPGLERAKAKIRDLFEGGAGGRLSTRSTPSEVELYGALKSQRYQLPDEEVLQVKSDIPGIDDDARETITTAWRFPVDTDSDGRYDTYTLYGIYLRTPETSRSRTPVEARTPPRTATGVVKPGCEGVQTSLSLVGGTGWAKAGSKLKKSVFVYVASVPITEIPNASNNDYEVYQGSQGFSALEYQQDVVRLPLTNNAVVYRDDLALAPGGGSSFQINGRVLTNSNLIATHFDTEATFYLVSGTNSCFYDDPENSKILVGGNVVNGTIGRRDGARNSVGVHLFDGAGNIANTGQSINATEQSVNEVPLDVMYNSEAYEESINQLIDNAPADLFGGITDPDLRETELRRYFEDRTRRVPYIEVDADVARTGYGVQGTAAANNYRPVDDWIYPTIVENGGEIGTLATTTGLSFETGQNYRLRATNPENQDIEAELGDRVLVGNGLPAVWYKNGDPVEGSEKQFIKDVNWIGSTEPRTRQSRIQEIPDTGSTERDGFWEVAAGTEPENELNNLGGLRVITGAGVYDRSLSFLPPPKLDVDPSNPSNLIIGTYDDPATTGTEQYTIVWPDTMPMSPIEGGKVYDNGCGTPGDQSCWVDFDPSDPNLPQKGDLQMRASVVYHYASESGHYTEEDANRVETDGWSAINKPEPIACVSSYYDPSTSITAKNEDGLGWNSDPNGNSNNGIVYNPPGDRVASSASPNANTGLFSGTGVYQQANMVFPDGRFVNQTLRDALEKSLDERSLSEQAAVDSTVCALGILDGTLSTANIIPDGAIYETSFLNAREVKAVDEDNNSTPDVDETFPEISPVTGHAGLTDYTTEYQLPLENRQPMEVRTTVLDVDLLKQNTISQATAGPANGGNEYLLPFSGIVYASRDDAIRDLTDASESVSATDSKLDPTRRPSGIMLVNGTCLARGDNCQGTATTVNEVVKEKGLILASDLPVYIKGNFNLHTQQEFTTNLTSPWTPNNFYNRDGLNPNFACRPGDPRLRDCNQGDDWRSATVLADAVTLLSDENGNNTAGFRFGFRNEGDFDLRNNAGNAQIGYDLNNNGSITTTPTVNESTFGFDLNGNGTDNDPTVAEYEVTAKAARLIDGFNAYNNFVTNGLSSGIAFDTNDDGTISETYDDSDYTGTGGVSSSYFNNFVTPIQRRGEFPEYLMEMCTKPFAAACGPQDWVVGYDVNGDGDYDDNVTAGATTKRESELTADDLVATILPNLSPAVDVFSTFNPTQVLAGTTDLPPQRDPADARFPRRISFLRDPSNNIDVVGGNTPVVFGIVGSGSSTNLECYLRNGSKSIPRSSGNHACLQYSTTSRPRFGNNALWLMTQNGNNANFGRDYPLWLGDPNDPSSQFSGGGTLQQPLVVPVLQIGATTRNPAANMTPANLYNNSNTVADDGTSWIISASGETNYNLILGTGDVPSRKINRDTGDFNGGLPNLPRTLESWQGQTIGITGSFIQFKRSEYATAPYNSILAGSPPPELFGVNDSPTQYRTGSTNGRTPYFSQPRNRDWGFDVGLLSQSPDLFAEKFTTPNSDVTPDEFFREISRDDEWVEALLCSKQVTLNDPDGNDVTEQGNAVPGNNRPTNCQN